MRVGLCIGAFILVAALLLRTSSALAQTERTAARPVATLNFEGDAATATCASAELIRESVATRLGYDPFVPEAARHVRVQVRARRRYVLIHVETVRADGTTGARDFEGAMSACGALLEDAVFAISIAIDPAAFAPRQPASEPVTAPEPVTASELVTAPEPVAEPAARSLRVALHAGLLASVGASFGVASVGAALGAELRYDDFRIALSLRADFPNSETVNGGSVDAHLLVADIAPCGLIPPFFACGVLTLGVLRGQGHRFDVDREVLLPHAALGARAGLETRIAGPLSFRAQVDLLAHLTWSTLQLNDTAIWTISPLSAVLGAFLVVDVEGGP